MFTKLRQAVLMMLITLLAVTSGMVSVAIGEVITIDPGGSSPREAVFSPDDQYVYVACGSPSDEVTVIRMSDFSIVRHIPVGYDPLSVGLTPDGQFLYATNTVNGYYTTKINAATGQVLANIRGGTDPAYIDFTPDGQFAYITNHWSSFLQIVSVATNQEVGRVNGIGNGGYGVEITPDGEYAFVVARSAGPSPSSGIYKISLSSQSIVATIPVTGGEGIAITPDGSEVWVPGHRNSNAIYVIDVLTSAIKAIIPVGDQPYDIAMSPNADYAYVTLNNDDSVSQIDINSHSVVGTIAVGERPRMVNTSSDGSQILVTNQAGNTLSLLHPGDFGSGGGQTSLEVWTDTDGHLWAENAYYKWDVTHGSSLLLKTGNEPRDWRIAGYNTYSLLLGRGGGNSIVGSRCDIAELAIEHIDDNTETVTVELSGTFGGSLLPVSLWITFYENQSFVKTTYSVAEVTSDPRPPSLTWNASLVPGGDVSTNDHYFFSGKGSESSFPYNSWVMFPNSSLQTVNNTEYVYVTEYDKDAQQGLALIVKQQETADHVSDINYGRITLNDAHYYGQYSHMDIYANSVISPTVYWYFYTTDPIIAYQPVEDLINSGGLNPVLPVLLDIKPGSCPNPLNVKKGRMDGESRDGSGGSMAAGDGDINPSISDGDRGKKAVLPVAILGTEEFDVALIDATTVVLAGVSPVRSSYEDVATPVGENAGECECNDYGPDGFDDMTIKFDKAEIVAALGEVSDSDVVPLTITGQLLDGTSFEGVDCVLIRAGGNRSTVEGDGAENDDAAMAGMNNYPNPFNPRTTISFSLPVASDATLIVYNLMGQTVATLADGFHEAGIHAVVWDGTAVASGVYFYRLEAGVFTQTKKMILMK